VSNAMPRRYKRQRGAATVESAIIMVVFLMLVMGIIEFALLIFNASSLVEATRAGSRYLIVNEPLVTLDDECTAAVSPDCGAGECDALLSRMQRFYSPLTADNLEITYRCSSTGYSEAFYDIYEVELRLVDVEYEFITPGILGLDSTLILPDFRSTRLSEDLDTVN